LQGICGGGGNMESHRHARASCIERERDNAGEVGGDDAETGRQGGDSASGGSLGGGMPNNCPVIRRLAVWKRLRAAGFGTQAPS
jgi:hypothetical protein